MRVTGVAFGLFKRIETLAPTGGCDEVTHSRERARQVAVTRRDPTLPVR